MTKQSTINRGVPSYGRSFRGPTDSESFKQFKRFKEAPSAKIPDSASPSLSLLKPTSAVAGQAGLRLSVRVKVNGSFYLNDSKGKISPTSIYRQQSQSHRPRPPRRIRLVPNARVRKRTLQWPQNVLFWSLLSSLNLLPHQKPKSEESWGQRS